MILQGNEKRILDVACGSKMFYFDKERNDIVYMDKRRETHTLCDDRTCVINPDIIGDFREIPFPNDSFYMVVFDPPHLLNAGKDSYMAQKYGVLDEMWPFDIAKGFEECMRVLKPNGTLIFKWNESDIPLADVLKAIPYQPILGQKNGRALKTHWLVFMK